MFGGSSAARSAALVFSLVTGQVSLADWTAWEAHMKRGLTYVQNANHQEAAKSFAAALDEAESHDRVSERVAITLNNLGMQYLSLGDYAAAEPVLKRSLAIQKAVSGSEHPAVGTSLNNLAMLHVLQGNHEQAQALLEESMVIAEKALGPEHPDVGTTLNNLAALYSARNNHSQAEPLLKRAIAIFEKSGDGPSHARALQNLASLYAKMGRTENAEQIRQEASVKPPASNPRVRSRDVAQTLRIVIPR